MRTETVRVVVGVLGLIRERMDQNLGKIRGASNIDDPQKITLPGMAHILRRFLPWSPYQDQGLAPVLGECSRQLTAQQKTIKIIIKIIIIIIIIIIIMLIRI